MRLPRWILPLPLQDPSPAHCPVPAGPPVRYFAPKLVSNGRTSHAPRCAWIWLVADLPAHGALHLRRDAWLRELRIIAPPIPELRGPPESARLLRATLRRHKWFECIQPPWRAHPRPERP